MKHENGEIFAHFQVTVDEVLSYVYIIPQWFLISRQFIKKILLIIMNLVGAS